MDYIIITAKNPENGESIELKVNSIEMIQNQLKMICKEVIGSSKEIEFNIEFTTEASKCNFIEKIGETQCQK